MKIGNELYEYCVEQNMHTRNWRENVKNEAIEKMRIWEEEAMKYGSYNPFIVKFNWNIGIDLMTILETKCCESVRYEFVLPVADRICQEIGKELTYLLTIHGLRFCVAHFRVNRLDEALMYLGPNEENFISFFRDEGLLMQEGYNAYMRWQRSLM
ncbi:MAG: hypothetical protein HFG94_05265 [Dorea sp.]|jgi:hypothetical protein|nr:hypothetical protein [Dorea sp.]